ncbi:MULTISPECIES: ribonuclease G [Pseudomonas]|jgi:ribonuclease G|uniref:RNAse G n=1 Tax=Pseudomonas psychrophila TaxID=122355 RepID=A0A8I1K8E8_9PSED|nr:MULTISPECIES: ribonuclease G [Pseudomonas]EPJ94313.1 ribonuclease G [Pseudomonas psychrophila]KAB0490454.1 ribonuclease G [Pseudomonas psychrophila]KMN01278.1 ribonuclease G [Pseudomonas psychrophila]KOX66159.1 ribonuclease G [Pseudomonas psychrophila]MBJ2257596.1 ribonuclease G [Pseudomonas psychrophila]
MSEEILINITPMESRVAVVENGVLQEVHVERTQRRGIVGNIYKGKIVRVLPGMQAAFVDIGLDRAAFIHASEISLREGQAVESISTLVHEGQSLVVQVTKDPIASKGARLTTQLSIPSRYLVYMPRTAHVGISLKIEDEAERERLKQVVSDCVAKEGIKETGGFILRTAAEGAGADEILMDIRYLRRLWDQIEAQIKTVGAPTVIYEDLGLALRTLRDLVSPKIEKIRIDSRETFQKTTQFVAELMPEIADRLEHYPGERPIFDLYGVEDEIQKALDRKVPLKSGGYLVVDPAEAMTTIDVNTGAFVGHRNLEETIFKTNLEAATAIARQLRLRNLGGIIIIDFIDMEDEEHQRQVLRTLEKQLERDHAKTNIIGITELGLVQMTRKRTRESLEQVLCEPCVCCQGRGKLKTPETICYEIFREILREARAYQATGYRVLANQKVVDRLLDEESGNVAELEGFIGRTIRFQVETMYSQEQYDVVLL